MDRQRLSEIRALSRVETIPGSGAWEFVSAIRDLLSALPHQSRLQAAERAVLDAVMSWLNTPRHADGGVDIEEASDRLQAVKEPAHRLRDLRAAQAAEECGNLLGAIWLTNESSRTIGVPTDGIRCDQPRGHDGECSGDLGRFQWRKST